MAAIGPGPVGWGYPVLNAFLNAYEVTVSPSPGGTTDPAPGTYRYAPQTKVTITALPNPGYVVSGWVVNGTPQGPSDKVTVTVTFNGMTVTANFKQASTKTITSILDVWATSANPATNMNGKGMGVGSWTYLNRSFLAFYIPDIGIPASDIQGAQIRLFGKALYPLTVVALFSANPFTENAVTWNNQPQPSALNGRQLMGSTSNIPTAEGWFTIDLDRTFLQQRMAAGNNYFIVILAEQGYPNEPAGDAYCYFDDREDGLRLGTGLAPQLVISYTSMSAQKVEGSILRP